MQLKGKKGKAGPRPEQRGHELAEERTDRWQEGAEAGREREGPTLNCRILARLLTSFETFRKSSYHGFVIFKMMDIIVSFPPHAGLL